MAFCARSPEAGAGFRTGFVLCALGAGILVFIHWRNGRATMREVLVVAVLLRIIVLPLPPTLSDDGFRYVWDGMLQAQESVNPYRYAPEDQQLSYLHDDFVYERMNSRSYFSVYPPLSQLAFAAGGLLYPLGWLFNWYLIKLLMVGGELLGLFLLGKLVRPRDLLLYAWHPLVVIETAGQAHTEALTIGLLVLVVWAARQSRASLVGAGLAAAGWVKLVPFVLAPFFLRRFGWRTAASGLVVGALLAAPYAAPYTIPHVMASLDLYVRAFEFNAGPYFALKGAAAGLGFGDASKTLGPILQWLFLLSIPAVFALDWKLRWPIERPLILVLSLFLLSSTTIHPWYLLPLLALLPLVMEHEVGSLFALGWFGLGLASLATYWVYADPRFGYVAVATGWIFFFGFMLMVLAKASLPAVLRRRAKRKWRRIESHLPDAVSAASHVLDLGAGEGFVGAVVREETGATVHLVDVVDLNRTNMPLKIYDGKALPFAHKEFDLAMLVFVLHHAEDAILTLREAVRVTNGSIAVLESVYKSPRHRRLLTLLDHLSNWIRSQGRMREQLEHVHFRTDSQWRTAFEEAGLTIEYADIRGKWVHLQALYILKTT